MKLLHLAGASSTYWRSEGHSLHQFSRQDSDKKCAAKDEPVNPDAKEHLENSYNGLLDIAPDSRM